MQFTYHSGSFQFRSKGTVFSVSVKELGLVLAGVVLFGALELQNMQNPAREGYVTRQGYGTGTVTEQVQVKGLFEGGTEELSVPVHGREYTDGEREEKLNTVFERIGPTVLNGNPSFSQVSTDLNLMSRDKETGFKLRWSSENPNLLDSFGHISETEQSALPEAGKTLYLQADVQAGQGYSKSFQLQVTVIPKPLSEKEKAEDELLAAVKQSEETSRTEEGFWLPKEFQGKSLSYSRTGAKDHWWFLALGPFLVILLRVRVREEEKKKRKVRDTSLLYEYSGLVSKLQIFLGAGMTVRSAWERMVLDYQKGLEEGKLVSSPAYEEMSQTFYQIRSGVPESRAYQDFGRRCMLQPYLKLGSLLEQNRKNGMKNLSVQLQLEVAEAFEQRKNLARRQGEEAATKLLAPLFLMLGIVMVIVVVPAFLTFY